MLVNWVPRIILWWFYGDFLIILTIYIKFNNCTDSIMAIAEDIFPSFSVMFATICACKKLNAFKFYDNMYVLWC